jgi:hypothetical protein
MSWSASHEPDVGPVHVDRHDRDPLVPLQQCVVDRLRAHRGERGGVGLNGAAVAPSLGQRRADCRQDVGRVDFEPRQHVARAEQEDAAIPVMLAAGQILLGALAVGLFDKAVDRPGARAERAPAQDIAVAGFGPRRRDAEVTR